MSSLIPSVSVPSTPAQNYAGSLAFEDRMAVLARLNAQAGLRCPETIVPPGTALIPYGEERRRALEAEVNALPLAADAIPAYLQRRALYQARDVRDSLGKLRMRADGKLERQLEGGKVGPAIGYNHTGLSQLVGFYGEALGTPSGMTRCLEFLNPSARAAAFNDMATRAEPKLGTEARVYRTIVHPVTQERFLRAVTSEKHVLAKGDGAAVAAQLSKQLPAGARLRITETWDRTTFEFFWPMSAREILVGDVVLARASVSISETKDISAQIIDGLLRVLCLNFTTAWYGDDTKFSTKHMGATFADRIGQAFTTSVNRISPFVQAFGDAYRVSLPGTRAELAEKATKVFELPAQTASAAVRLWDADGARSAGDTLGGFVNALTRASQELVLKQAEVVEEAAGRLIVEGWAALN